MTIRFDDSLPALVDVLSRHLDAASISEGVIVRDVKGRLCYLHPCEIGSDRLETLQDDLRASLGGYAREDRVVGTAVDFGVAQMLADSSAIKLVVNSQSVRLLDRRLVGADWLRKPAAVAMHPPRFAFASLKGGVGRSTALVVAAAHFAAQGMRVLALDLDLEAPGLGSLLLDYGTLPPYGLIDALVENDVSGLDQAFITDLVGPSSLSGRMGRVDVLPAFGRRSVDNPGEVLSKIARAYAEDVTDQGVLSFRDQVAGIVEQVGDPSRYDVILIDARAGLHETSATAILGLGAEVLLFGLDEEQTFQGYAALLFHLARLAGESPRQPEWLQRISFVQGKAPVNEDSRLHFAERCKQLYIASGIERSLVGAREAEPQPPANSFSDVPWDDEAPDEDVLPAELFMFRDPVAILHDDHFRNFNPLARRDLLTERVYKASYGSFLDSLQETFYSKTENAGQS